MKPIELLGAYTALRGFLASSDFTDAEKLTITRDFLKNLPPRPFCSSFEGTFDLVHGKALKELNDRLPRITENVAQGTKGPDGGTEPVPNAKDETRGLPTDTQNSNGSGSLTENPNRSRVQGRLARKNAKGKG